MPLNIDLVQVLLHLLNFVILAGGLTLLLYNPIRSFLEKRAAAFAEQEEKNRRDAEENARRSAELDMQKEAAEKEIAEARMKSEQETADAAKAYLDASRAEAAAILQKAEHDAEKRKEHILDSAQTEIGELVIGAAQKLLVETATPEQTQALYDAFLDNSEQAQAGRENHI